VTTWSFPERLSFANGQADLAEELWGLWWPAMRRVPLSDKASQVAGVDACLVPGDPAHFHRGGVLVEEKVRGQEFDDVLLETVSNDARETPGWAVKGSASRLLLYCFSKTRRGWVFPMQTVQRVTRANKGGWEQRFGLKLAQNPGYVSYNVPVPLVEFLRAVDKAHGPVACARCKRACRWSELRGPVFCQDCRPAPFAVGR